MRCACVSHVLLCGASLLRLATASGQPIYISPVGSFNVHQAVPETLKHGSLAVSRIMVRNGDLFFLVWTEAMGKDIGGRREAILRTDAEGHYKSCLLLPGAMDVRTFDVDDSGNVYVLQDWRDATANGKPLGQRLLVYDRAGVFVRSGKPPEFVDTICWAGGTLVGVSAEALIYPLEYLDKATVRPHSLRFSDVSVSAAGLSDGTLLIFDCIRAQVHLADLTSGRTTTLQPKSPEVHLNESEGMAALFAFAASPLRDIFLGVSGFKVFEAAPVLRINTVGEITQELRLVLPIIPQETGWSRYFFPVGMAADTQRLYVLDARGIVAFYQP